MEQTVTWKSPNKLFILLFSLIFLAGLLQAANSLNPPVQFKDQGLESAIRDKLSRQHGPIYQNDIISITVLNAVSKDIRSLDGIDALSRLVVLNLADNSVEDLSPLSSLSMLRELNLENNKIIDLAAMNFEEIIHLPIRKLSLGQNVLIESNGSQRQLSDIHLLGNLPQLEILELNDNIINDISPFASLTNLKVLDLRGNQVSDLEPLRYINSLIKLNIRENAVKDLEPLVGLTGLIYLNIQSNPVSSGLDSISNLTNLQTLNLRNVKIGEDFQFLENLTKLQSLNLRNTSISDVSFLAELIKSGALQNDKNSGIYATLNLLENDFSGKDTDTDPYVELRPYWHNITYRYPFSFPYFQSNVNPPLFSHQSGFYEEGFYLTLTTYEPGGRIFYTVDGAEPIYNPLNQEISSTREYSNPILVKSKRGESNYLSVIETGHPEISSFVPSSEVFKVNIVRAIVVNENEDRSNVETHAYFVDENMHDRYTFPVMSIVTDATGLFDNKVGIYVPGDLFENIYPHPNQDPGNYTQRGLKWERPIHFQMISHDGKVLISQNAGLRIHGSGSRWFAQKSLRLYASEKYDKQVFFKYIFFPSLNNRLNDLVVDTFETLILRNSGQDWQWRPTMFRDALAHSLLEHTKLDIQGVQPVIVFLNGEYWGIHNIRTRYDDYYFQSYYGISTEDLVILENNFNLMVGSGYNVENFKNIFRMIDNDYYGNNFKTVSTLSDPTVYENVTKLIDIDNFIDYFTSNIYFANDDWPGSNILLWKKKVEDEKDYSNYFYGHDGKWRWMIFDIDFGFRHTTYNTLLDATRDDGEYYYNAPWSTYLIRSLLENHDFKLAFINRFSDHLNTSFREDVVINKINEFEAIYYPEIEEQIHRWGNLGDNIKNWLNNVEKLREFASLRPTYQRQHILDYFNLSGTATITVQMESSKGYIRINTIDIKEDVVGVDNPSNWSGIYFQGIPIKISAIPYDGYRFVKWEGVDDLVDDTRSPVIQIELNKDIIISPVFAGD
jgi:Leucine-rich repeat (LRR) protein